MIINLLKWWLAKDADYKNSESTGKRLLDVMLPEVERAGLTSRDGLSVTNAITILLFDLLAVSEAVRHCFLDGIRA